VWRYGDMAGRNWFNELHTPSSGILLEIGRPIAYRKSPYQEIWIFHNPLFGKVLVLDGCVMTTEKDEFFYHEMLAHPALTTHPKPERVLIIGGGDGGTLREVLRYHEVKKATLVELDREVVDLAKQHLPSLSESFSDPRSEVVIGDGAKFVKTAENGYDVVLIDSTDPVGPAEILFSEGFYRDIKSLLGKDGVLALQCESPFLHMDFIKSQKKILSSIFGKVNFYNTVVPTYPGSLWSFAFASDTVDPLELKRKPPEGLRYYDERVHRAAFTLPPFMRDELEG